MEQKKKAGGCCGTQQPEQFVYIESVDKTPEAKVIFVGSNGVGKTCIIKNFVDGGFNQN